MNYIEIKAYNKMRSAFINILKCAMCNSRETPGAHYRSWERAIVDNRLKVSDLLVRNVNGECRNTELKMFMDNKYENIYEDARLWFEKVTCSSNQYVKNKDLKIPSSPAVSLSDMIDVLDISTEEIISITRMQLHHI